MSQNCLSAKILHSTCLCTVYMPWVSLDHATLFSRVILDPAISRDIINRLHDIEHSPQGYGVGIGIWIISSVRACQRI